MAALTLISRCDDGSCCCIPHRSMTALVSIINLFACILENKTSYTCRDQWPDFKTLVAEVASIKQLLVTLFQVANLLLLLASMVESAILVKIYVWFTLGFVVMELMVTIVDFLFKYKTEGNVCFVEFITEVGFLFVVLRCLPLVDIYRKHLNGES